MKLKKAKTLISVVFSLLIAFLVANLVQADSAIETEFISGPSDNIGYQNPTFWWMGTASNQQILGFDYALNGQSNFTQSNHVTFRDLTDGAYTLSVSAITVDGKKDPTPVVRSFRVQLDFQAELEFNNRQAEANPVLFNRTIRGVSLDKNDVDWFQYSLTAQSGLLTFTLSRDGGTGATNLLIYQEQVSEENLVHTARISDINSQFVVGTVGLNRRKLTGETRYYLQVVPEYVDADHRSYFLTISGNELGTDFAWDAENNDSYIRANRINPTIDNPLTIIGDKNHEGDQDWFRLYVNKNQSLTLSIIRPLVVGPTTIDIYRSPLITDDINNRKVGQITVNVAEDPSPELLFPLVPGEYFLVVDNSNITLSADTVDSPYFVNVSLAELDPNMDIEIEPNNVSPFVNSQQATKLSLGDPLSGTHWDSQNDVDWFQIDLSQSIFPSKTRQSFLIIDLQTTLTAGWIQVEVYDSIQQVVGQNQFYPVSAITDEASQLSVPVSNSRYFIRVSPFFSSGTASYQLTTNLIKSISHSAEEALALGETLTVVMDLPVGQITALTNPQFELIGEFSPSVFPERLAKRSMVLSDNTYIGTYIPQLGEDITSAFVRVTWKPQIGSAVVVDLPRPIQIDTVAPYIESIQHNGSGVLSAGDRLTVQVIGDFDPTDQVYVEIQSAETGQVQLRFPLQKQELSAGQSKTGMLSILKTHQVMDGIVTARSIDTAGNAFVRKHPQKVIIIGNSPKIELVQHNADQPLKFGQTLVVTMKPYQPDPNIQVIGSGYFQLGNQIDRFPLKNQNGLLRGTYTVKATDDLADVAVHVFYEPLNQPLVQITLPDKVTLDGIRPKPIVIEKVTDIAEDDGYQLQVEWKTSTDPKIVGYNIYLKDRPIRVTDQPLIYNLGPELSQKIIQVDQNGIPYYIAVTAVSQVGNESEIDLGSLSKPTIAFDNLPPPPVAVVSAVDTIDDFGGSVTVSWTQPSRADDFSYYQVHRSIIPPEVGKNKPEHLSIKVQHPYVTSVEMPTTADTLDHHFFVTAVDLAGNESHVIPQSISEPTRSHSNWARQPEPVDGIEWITTALGPIRQDSLTFRWFSAEQTFTYYQLDGGRLQPTTANELTLTGLTVGQHQLALLSEDQEQKVIRKFNVYRSPLSEREPNDSMLEADVLPFGWQVYGNLTSQEIDVYRLEVVESGLIDLHWSSSNSNIAIEVKQFDTTIARANSNGGKFSLGLGVGSYFVLCEGIANTNYSLASQFSLTKNWEFESNELSGTLPLVGTLPSSTVFGALNSPQDNDRYRIVLPTDGILVVNYISQTENETPVDISIQRFGTVTSPLLPIKEGVDFFSANRRFFIYDLRKGVYQVSLSATSERLSSYQLLATLLKKAEYQINYSKAENQLTIGDQLEVIVEPVIVDGITSPFQQASYNIPLITEKWSSAGLAEYLPEGLKANQAEIFIRLSTPHPIFFPLSKKIDVDTTNTPITRLSHSGQDTLIVGQKLHISVTSQSKPKLQIQEKDSNKILISGERFISDEKPEAIDNGDKNYSFVLTIKVGDRVEIGKLVAIVEKSNGATVRKNADQLIRIDGILPIPVTNPLSQDIAGDKGKKIRLTWTPPPGGFSHYNIYRSLSPANIGQLIVERAIVSNQSETSVETVVETERNQVPFYFTVATVDDSGNQNPVQFPVVSAINNQPDTTIISDEILLENEPNQTFSNATLLPINRLIHGFISGISGNDEIDYYKLKVPEDGQLAIELVAGTNLPKKQSAIINLRNNADNLIEPETSAIRNTSERTTYIQSYNLSQDSYLIEVNSQAEINYTLSAFLVKSVTINISQNSSTNRQLKMGDQIHLKVQTYSQMPRQIEVAQVKSSSLVLTDNLSTVAVSGYNQPSFEYQTTFSVGSFGQPTTDVRVVIELINTKGETGRLVVSDPYPDGHLSIDVIPPQILTARHSAVHPDGSLRQIITGEELEVSLTGESNNRAFVTLRKTNDLAQSETVMIQMEEQSSDDSTKQLSIYEGSILIPEPEIWRSLQPVELIVTLIDSAGNESNKNVHPLFTPESTRTKNTGKIKHDAVTTLKTADIVTIVVDVPTENKINLAVIDADTNQTLVGRHRFIRKYPSQHTYQLKIQTGDNFQSGLVTAYLAQPLSDLPTTLKSTRPISADTVAPLPVSALEAVDMPDDNGNWVVVSWPRLTQKQRTSTDKYKIYLSQLPIQSFGGRIPVDLFAFSISHNSISASAEITNSVLVKLEKTDVDYHIGLTVVDLAGNESTIVTTTGRAVDNRMPPAVTIISAADTPFDNGGFVTLDWEPTQITDFLAYRVYRSSFPITDLSGLPVTLVITSLNLSSVEVPTSGDTGPGFYAVTVLDLSGNQSLLEKESVTGPIQSVNNMASFTSPSQDNHLISLVSSPLGVLRQNSATFRFMPNWSIQPDQPTPTIYYRLDQNPYQPIAGYQLTIHNLSPGQHTFSIKTDGVATPGLQSIHQHSFLVRPTLIFELEPNDTVNQANNLTPQAMIQGSNHSTNDLDWFRLILSTQAIDISDHNFDLYFHRPMGTGETQLALFSADMQPLAQVRSRPENQQRVHLFAKTKDQSLFLRIRAENESPSSDYQLSLSTSRWHANAITQEFTSSVQNNQPLLSNDEGTLALFGQTFVGESYRLNLAGPVRFSLSSPIEPDNSKLYLKIFAGSNLAENRLANQLNNQIGLLKFPKDQQWVNLSEGSYTLVVSPILGESSNTDHLSNYQILVESGKNVQFTEKEPNNTMNLATPIPDLDQMILGLHSDERDWYRFDLPKTDGWLCVAKPEGINNSVSLSLFSSDGTAVPIQVGETTRTYGNQVWMKVEMLPSNHGTDRYNLQPLFIQSVSHNAENRILGGPPGEKTDLVVQLQLAPQSAEQLTSANFKITAPSISSQIVHTLVDQGKGQFIGKMEIPQYLNLTQGQLVIEMMSQQPINDQQFLNFRGQLTISEPINIDTVPPTIISVEHDAVTVSGLSQPIGLRQTVEIRLIGSGGNQAKFQIRQKGNGPTLAQGIMKKISDPTDSKDRPNSYIGYYTIEASTIQTDTQNTEVIGILSDLAGNTTQLQAPISLVIDTRSPNIDSLSYQILRLGKEIPTFSTLLPGDQLTVTLVGETDCQAYCLIGQRKFDLYDDGTHGDIQSNDGVYTAICLITEADFVSETTTMNGFLTDQAGNTDNRFADRSITIDTKPPKIEYIQHNATRALIMGDQLLVYLKGELGCSASFDIGQLTGNIMVDDGSGKDQKAHDGVYTGQYSVRNELNIEIRAAVVIGHLVDSGGNTQTIQSAQPVTIDAVPPRIVTGVKAIDVPKDQGSIIEVSWNVAEESDFSRYQVYRETAPIRSTLGLIPIPTPLLDLKQTLTLISAPRNNFDYYIAVTAVDIAGNESEVSTSQLKGSTFGPVQAIDNLAPPAVVGVQAKDRPDDNGKTILVQWQPLPQEYMENEVNSEYKSDFQAYHIYRYTSRPALQQTQPGLAEEQGPNLVGTIIDPSIYQVTVNVPKNRVNYYVSVVAIDENGNRSSVVDSSLAGPIQAIDQIAPLPVVGVQIRDTPSDSGTGVTVSWEFPESSVQDEIDHYLIILSARQPTIDDNNVMNLGATPLIEPIKVRSDKFNQLPGSLKPSQKVTIPQADLTVYAAVVAVDEGGNQSKLGVSSIAGPVRAVSNYVYPQIETTIQAGFAPKTNLVLPPGVIGSEITTLDILEPTNSLLNVQIEEANFYLGTANIERTHDDELKPTIIQIDGQVERLSKSAKLTIGFSAESIPASVVPNLRIFRLNPYGKLTLWDLVPGKQTIDIENQTVTANISQLTVFRIAHLRLPTNLDQVVVYPNPFVSSQSINRQVTFLKLTENATVSLYTLDGERVRTKLESTTGRAVWDGLNDAGAEVISGLYIYHIEGEGVQKVGQIMVIR